MQSYNKANDAFPGGATPAVVAIAGDASDPELKAAVVELRKRALSSSAGLGPIDVEVAPRGEALTVEIPLVGARARTPAPTAHLRPSARGSSRRRSERSRASSTP